MFKDDLFASGSSINLNKLSIINENQPEISSSKDDKISEENISYLDLFTSNEISPYFIVSFQEYILVVNIIYLKNYILLLFNK